MEQVWSSFLSISCLLSASFAIVSNNSDDVLDVRVTLPVAGETTGGSIESDKCLFQLHTSLEKLRKRQASSKVASLIDLSGYALHQALRNAPVDMYVTDIKVRAPSVGSWVQVQRCQFSRQAEMRTNLLFSDLLVSGVVRLLPGDLPMGSPQGISPPEHCTMTLRLRRAGLELRAAPHLSGGPKVAGRGTGIQVRTESNFVDPHFLSVHAYGCKLDQWARNGWFDFPPSRSGPVPEENSSRRSSRMNDEQPEVRIISLGQEPELVDYSSKEDDEMHRQRILSYKTPSEKLAAVLNVKQQFAQQANAVFQAHGPFSQQPNAATHQKPIFTSHYDLPKPAAPAAAVSTITELDEDLRPVRPVSQHSQHPFHSLVSPATALPNLPLYGAPSQLSPLQDVSSEMEDVFLRGAKALLAKYLEKQLEIPLKEALMTKIGYTVSYG